MRSGKRKILHLIDFIKLAEKSSPEAYEFPRVRIRNPDEEVRVAPWREMYPNRATSIHPSSVKAS